MNFQSVFRPSSPTRSDNERLVSRFSHTSMQGNSKVMIRISTGFVHSLVLNSESFDVIEHKVCLDTTCVYLFVAQFK